MAKQRLNIVDEMALSRLEKCQTSTSMSEPSYGDWIRIVRNGLRMTQTELAQRAHVSQPHLAGIERGKIDPQVSTLKRIYEALSCELSLEPRPKKPIPELLRGRARSVALKRLKHSMGTMALEGQAPDADVFRHLLEKRTDEILSNQRESLTPG
jgi:transcriptional regulator with XRE-family HTH domain